MENIKIISTGSYLPKQKINNEFLANKLGITEEFIVKRTGIQNRYYTDKETIIDLAVNAAQDAMQNLLQNTNQISKNESKDILKDVTIDMIIVATTSSKELMPGISFRVKNKLKQYTNEKCICQDILAGCSGYINAFDIARNTIITSKGKINTALIIGVELLSKLLKKDDIGTSIILADGAGATIITKTEEEKEYRSNFTVHSEECDILTCKANSKIYMDGKAVYKYAVTKTVENVKELVTNEQMQNINFFIPHQSNLKIIQSIASKLNLPKEKVFVNIETKGNTFCASIPIALDDLLKNKQIHNNDKIILLGYGGGMNTGSIYIEI